MVLALQDLIFLMTILLFVESNVVEDDFGDDIPKKKVSDPYFSARGTSVMRIPNSAKVDSRARGETRAFKQNASELTNPDDYSDENVDIPITLLPSTTEVEYSTAILTSTTIDDGESWELTTSLNIVSTSHPWATWFTTTKISTISKRNKNTEISNKTTRRLSGMQPLQQLHALKSWMNEQQNQSESIQIKNLVKYLKP